LKNINLHITPGESLAIVGENGSGKTTLIKLLTRLYSPTQGCIKIDGLELKEWDIDALRQKIGVIFQDFARYQLIVGENIGIGDVANIEEDAQIEEAATKGMADVFVKDLPKGYKTQLGTWFKDGKELSGGQWQKIALSRAFMRSQADILILDEPTAAIDAKAEAEIFAHFRELTANRISIIISHRFSTVRMADHIIVLEKGEVIEQGSHSELLEADHQYAKLFKLQAKGYQ
jgi:ATP-binding cassette, subfamily B, bacterial